MNYYLNGRICSLIIWETLSFWQWVWNLIAIKIIFLACHISVFSIVSPCSPFCLSHYHQLVLTDAVIAIRNPSLALQEFSGMFPVTKSKFWFWMRWRHSENIFSREENNSFCFVLCFSTYIIVTGLQQEDSGCLGPIPMRYSNRNSSHINAKHLYC